MSLVILCGPPCSGKSLTAEALVYVMNLYRHVALESTSATKDLPSLPTLPAQLAPVDLENAILPAIRRRAPSISSRLQTVVRTVVISEHEQGSSLGPLYGTTSAESVTTSTIRARLDRELSTDAFVIVDAQNSIKGYRYECFCAARGVLQHPDDKMNFALVYCGETGTAGGEHDKYKDYNKLRAEYSEAQLEKADPHYADFPDLIKPPTEDPRGSLPSNVHDPNRANTAWQDCGPLVESLRYKFEVPNPYRDRWDQPLYYAHTATTRTVVHGYETAAASNGNKPDKSAFDQSGMNDRAAISSSKILATPSSAVSSSSFVKKVKKKKNPGALTTASTQPPSGEYLSSLTISEDPQPPAPPPSSSSDANLLNTTAQGGDNDGNVERNRTVLRARSKLTNLFKEIEACVPRIGSNDTAAASELSRHSAKEQFVLNLVDVIASILGGAALRCNMSTKVAHTASANFLHASDRAITVLMAEMKQDQRYAHIKDWAGVKDGFVKWIRYAPSEGDVVNLFREYVGAQASSLTDYQRKKRDSTEDEEP